jgi:hypothetical protein
VLPNLLYELLCNWQHLLNWDQGLAADGELVADHLCWQQCDAALEVNQLTFPMAFILCSHNLQMDPFRSAFFKVAFVYVRFAKWMSHWDSNTLDKAKVIREKRIIKCL